MILETEETKGTTPAIPFNPDSIPLEHIVDQDEGFDLLCPIDQVLLKNPCKLPCGHKFCKSCITRWLDTSLTCPVCRKTTTKDSVKPSEETNLLLQSIMIKCGHSGCSWVGKLSEYKDPHLKADCLFHELECPYGCNTPLTRGKLEAHLPKCELNDPKAVQKLKETLEELERQNLELRKNIAQHKAVLAEEHRKVVALKEEANLIQPLLKEDTESILAYAKLAERAEQHDDMRLLMTEMVRRKVPLSVEGRNLFAVSYKQCMGKLRNALRILIEEEARAGNSADRVEEVFKLKEKTITSIETMAGNVLKLLDDNLLKRELTDEDKVFYTKMNADYLRFLAECSAGEDRKEKGQRSKEKYIEGTELANKALKLYNPVRLGIILNYTVLLYEITEEKQDAIKIATTTLQEGIETLEHLPDSDYKDTCAILQLMKDNIQLWTEEDG